MALTRAWRRAIVCVVVCVGVAFLVSLSGCNAITAGNVLRDAARPAHVLRPYVEEREVVVEGAHGATRAVLIRPRAAEGALPAFVLCPGAVEDGPEEPRMRALGRALAMHGATVLAPDLASLRRFRISVSDVDRLVETAVWLADHELAEDGRVAFLGICVGGSYAVVAAGDARLAGRVSGVLAMGAFDDMERLLHRWMVEPVEAPELFDPLTEGRRRVIAGNLDRLVEAADAASVARVVEALIRGEREHPEPPEPAGERARRVLAAARSDRPLPAAEARFVAAPLGDDLRALSPRRAAADPGATVYVLHGTTDPVVPYAEGEALAASLEDADIDVCFHGTDVFRHVDAVEEPSFWEAWPLLRFLGSFLGDAGM